MIIKHWRKNGSFYFMKANFKLKTAYTDVIQFSLKDPWLFPKYEDDFAEFKGFMDGCFSILDGYIRDYFILRILRMNQ